MERETVKGEEQGRRVERTMDGRREGGVHVMIHFLNKLCHKNTVYFTIKAYKKTWAKGRDEMNSGKD